MSAVESRRIWNIAEQDRAAITTLAERLNTSAILSHLLLQRGIDTAEKAERFLMPRLEDLSDPFLLTDMDLAVARITQARDAGESIRIFGDYDVDGVSATAILLHGLKRFGCGQCSYGMPLRLSEGYGLNAQRVEEAHAEGVSLIITVDNGINAHDAAEKARELGVGLIITDHHTLDEHLPHADAVINPKRETPAYPGFHLCGAGVAFKLSQALNGTPNDLDIAALGTVADIVPLLDENRVIVTLGLRHMAKHQRVGLRKLASTSGLAIQNVTSENIGFQLGPRINAAGRLDDAMTALRLLISDCPDETGAMAILLNEANEDRRAIEREIFEEAMEELSACFSPRQRSIVLARRGWHVGVIGIVASRIQHQFNRPVVMIAVDEDGVARGSARSSSGFDMVAGFNTCERWLDQFGGHKSAAGLTMQEVHIDPFRHDFEAAALDQLGEGELLPELDIDVLAHFTEIDSALLNALAKLEPIGHQNPAPVFCSLNVELVPQSVRILKDKHLKASFRQGDRVFSAIGFNMAERFYTDNISGSVDIAYTPQFNTWQGETTIQLLLKDMREAE